MKNKPSDPSSADELDDSLADVAEAGSKASTAKRRALLRADRLLAKRCVGGEVAAWDELYRQCHEPLVVSIRVMLGAHAADTSLVDEISARVWYALVANDGELLSRYQPRRGGRLITFLRILAREEIVHYLRSEVRRRNRELAAFQEGAHGDDRDAQSVNALNEFLAMLTPQERLFCNEHLLAMPGGAVESEYTNSNIWQLSHRIRKKLQRFLRQD